MMIKTHHRAVEVRLCDTDGKVSYYKTAESHFHVTINTGESPREMPRDDDMIESGIVPGLIYRPYLGRLECGEMSRDCPFLSWRLLQLLEKHAGRLETEVVAASCWGDAVDLDVIRKAANRTKLTLKRLGLNVLIAVTKEYVTFSEKPKSRTEKSFK